MRSLLRDRRVAKLLTQLAKKYGKTAEEQFDEIMAWMTRFQPLAEKHEIEIVAVLSVHHEVYKSFVAAAHKSPDWHSILRRDLGRVADEYGIPAQDMAALVTDLQEMILSGCDAPPGMPQVVPSKE